MTFFVLSRIWPMSPNDKFREKPTVDLTGLSTKDCARLQIAGCRGMRKKNKVATIKAAMPVPKTPARNLRSIQEALGSRWTLPTALLGCFQNPFHRAGDEVAACGRCGGCSRGDLVSGPSFD